MLHLRSSNGYENNFALEVYSSLYASTITTSTLNSPTLQFIRTSNMVATTGVVYYIKLINQLTQKSYFALLGEREFGISNFRSKSFYLFLDDAVEDYHININSDGLYNYEIYWGNVGATSETDAQIVAKLTNGMALVHNDNFVNDYFQNSTNGVEPMTIPNAISYNG